MIKGSYQVIIIGGGAAGMASAVAALREMAGAQDRAETDCGRVLLLESNDRVGKKILATGNGKCNFTHAEISMEHYHTDAPAVLNSVLTDFPTEAALCFFEGLGMLSREKNGFYYPLTETASTVLDVLRLRLAELGSETLCSASVERVEKSGKGFWVGFTAQGKRYGVRAGSVIMATGSKAGGFLQDRGEDPLRIPKSLGLQSTPLYPALTKCICREGEYYRQLAGVRARVILKLFCESAYVGESAETAGCKKSAWEKTGEERGIRRKERNRSRIKSPAAGDGRDEREGRKFLRQEAGELQLTKEGISGIAVFQLSGEIAQKLSEGRRMFVEINFLPDFAEKELEDWAGKRLSLLSGRTLEEFFLGVLHKKILGVCLQAEGVRGAMQLPQGRKGAGQWRDFRENGTADDAEKRALRIICSVMKRAMHFTTEVTAVSDMKQAQVCRGGLYLSQFNEKLECKKMPGLFACGEMLNVDGDCGGYNLHFAWASGVLAGREAAGRSKKKSMP